MTDFNTLLLQYAREGNYAAIQATLNSLSPAERNEIFPSTIHFVIDELVIDVIEKIQTRGDYTPMLESLDFFTSTFGDRIDAFMIENMLTALARAVGDYGNGVEAIKILTDDLSPQAFEMMSSWTKQAVFEGLANAVLRGAYDERWNQESTLLEDATAAIRDFAQKVGHNTDAYSLENALNNLAYIVQETGKGFEAIDAITDYLSPHTFETISSMTIQAVFKALAEAVSRGAYDVRWNQDNTLLEEATAALRDFAQKVGQSADAHSVESALYSLANIVQETGFGFDAIDAITDYLSPQTLETISSWTKQTVFEALANAVSRGAYDVRWNQDNTLLEEATAALRDFAQKVGHSTDAYSLENALNTLANVVQETGFGFEAIDAITDNLSDYTLVTLSTWVKQTVFEALANAVSRGAYDVRWNQDNTLLEEATAALRDFAEKVGSSTDAYSVENALNTLANVVQETGFGFEAIDAITDNLSDYTLVTMSTWVKQTVFEALADAVSRGAYDVRWNQDNTLLEEATAALRDFAQKVGQTLDVYSMEYTLSNLAQTVQNTGLGFEAIDAVIQNFNFKALQQLSSGTIQQLLSYVSAAYADTVRDGDDTNGDKASDTFGLLVQTFSAVITSADIEPSLYNLGDVKATGMLQGLVSILPATFWDTLPPAFKSHLQTQTGLYFGSSTTESITTTIDARDDIVFALAGNDTVRTNAGNDTVFAGTGNDYVYAGTGNDTVYGEQGTDFLYGEEGSDTLVGGDGTDYLYAVRAGSNFEIAGAVNVLDGGEGNDFLFASSGKDFLYGGNGTDAALYLYATSGVSVDLTKGGFAGDANGDVYNSIENVYGSNYNDAIYGTSANNVIYGYNGHDIMSGNAGNDTLSGMNGNDNILGGTGNDTIFGGADNDWISGDDGNDTIYGDAGNDILYGGKGADTITGGMGADRFGLLLETGVRDTIKDFKVAEGDKLDISNIFHINPLTQTITDYVKATTSGTSQILSVDLDGKGAGAAVAVAVLENVGTLDILTLYKNGQIIA